MSCHNTFQAKHEKFQELRNELNHRLIQTSRASLKNVGKYRPQPSLSSVVATLITPTWLYGQPGSQLALSPLMFKALRPTRGAELMALEADELHITTLLHL